MILRRRQTLDRVPIRKRQDGYFRTGQVLLNDDLVPGRTEFLVHQDGLQRLFGLVECLGQKHTLPRGQTRGLQDDALKPTLGEVLARLLILFRGERLEAGGRDRVPGHKVLAERLGAFEEGGLGRRTKDGDAGCRDRR